MSAPAKDGPDVPGKKKGSLLSRMKTVLKRSDGSKRLSFSSRSTPTAGPSTTTQPKPTELLLTTTLPSSPTKDAEKDNLQIPAGATKIMRSQIDADRALRLAERFAVTIEPLSAGPDKETYRIEKPIRMRIHRSCHRCNATFGNNKICAGCEHVRCKQCPRYPAKKVEKEGKDKVVGGGGVGVGVGEWIEADTYYGLREQIVLTKPSPKPNAQPLVRKKPMQRVRRNCHECGDLFGPGVKICGGCQHVRCADCPRDPAKKKKYPDGYPGDAPSSDTSKPVKHTCHKCLKTFPPIPHPDSAEGRDRKERIAAWKLKVEKGKEREGGSGSGGDGTKNVDGSGGGEKEEEGGKEEGELKCIRCGHELCADCPRAKPVKVEPVPDPDVLRSVREKLARISVAAGGE